MPHYRVELTVRCVSTETHRATVEAPSRKVALALARRDFGGLGSGYDWDLHADEVESRTIQRADAREEA